MMNKKILLSSFLLLCIIIYPIINSLNNYKNNHIIYMKNEIDKMSNEFNKMIADIEIINDVISNTHSRREDINEKYIEMNAKFDKNTNIYHDMVESFNDNNNNIIVKIIIYKIINELFENTKKISTNMNEIFDNYKTSIGLTAYYYKSYKIGDINYHERIFNYGGTVIFH